MSFLETITNDNYILALFVNNSISYSVRSFYMSPFYFAPVLRTDITLPFYPYLFFWNSSFLLINMN